VREAHLRVHTHHLHAVRVQDREEGGEDDVADLGGHSVAEEERPAHTVQVTVVGARRRGRFEYLLDRLAHRRAASHRQHAPQPALAAVHDDRVVQQHVVLALDGLAQNRHAAGAVVVEGAPAARGFPVKDRRVRRVTPHREHLRG